MLDDSLGWMKVKGSFRATGGEQYMVIGCFTPWASLQKRDIGQGDARCYYYLDDISVKAQTSNALLAMPEAHWRIYPNPAGERVYIRRQQVGEGLVFRLCDLSGKEVLYAQGQAGKKQFSLQLGALPRGVYLLQIESVEQRFVEKIILR